MNRSHTDLSNHSRLDQNPRSISHKIICHLTQTTRTTQQTPLYRQYTTIPLIQEYPRSMRLPLRTTHAFPFSFTAPTQPLSRSLTQLFSFPPPQLTKIPSPHTVPNRSGHLHCSTLILLHHSQYYTHSQRQTPSKRCIIGSCLEILSFSVLAKL